MVAEDFDEGVIKDCDSDAEAAAQAPSATGTGISGSLDADVDLTHDSASCAADCRCFLDLLYSALRASQLPVHAYHHKQQER